MSAGIAVDMKGILQSRSTEKFIAYRRKDGDEQSLISHLTEVGEIAAELASKTNVASAGELIGLLHDVGKFSAEFQAYIGSATGKISSDDEEYVDYDGLKGKIDHSSAGAQWLWGACQKWGQQGQLVGQILSLCIVSHHSGLIDCLKLDGENGFLKSRWTYSRRNRRLLIKCPTNPTPHLPNQRRGNPVLRFGWKMKPYGFHKI